MTSRGRWLWAVVWLALGCAGPGLETPGDRNASAGTGGAGVMAGAGGTSGTSGGGFGNPDGPGGTGGVPVLDPGDVTDAGTDEEQNGGDASTPSTSDDGGVLRESEELVGPEYMGSVSNGAECATNYPTRGYQPAASSGERFPLFLYFVGTEFVPGDASATYASDAALKVTEAMARRGFVALSVEYDNDAIAWLSDHQNQLACLFDGGKPASLIARACALPNVDCDAGIATWGHSQGAYVAHMAHNREPRVSAVWATGYGGDATSTLPPDRLRVVNGEADAGDNGTAAKLEMITGMTADECNDPDQCLRDDGSGWIIVRKSQLALPDASSADHCWFDRQSCSAGTVVLEPTWIDPASDRAYALEANADWIASTARR